MEIAAISPRWYFFAVRRLLSLLLLAFATSLARADGDAQIVQNFQGNTASAATGTFTV